MQKNAGVQENNNSPSISQAEIYAYYFQNPNPEPACYTRIPDILHHLTYTDSESGEILRLSIHAKMLYIVIKQITGDGGHCWKSAKNLADQCNMSEGMVTKCKKELTMPFHQLDGNSLIKIEIKQKSIMQDDQCIGKSTYHNCSLTDIWRWNIAFMRSKAYQIESEAESPHEDATPAQSCHDLAPQGAQSCGEPNKTPNNKISMFKEQDSPANAGSDCSSNKKNRLFLSEEQRKNYEWMTSSLPEHERPDENLAYKIATSYPSTDIKKAAEYIKQIMINYRNKHRQNKQFEHGYIAYFQHVLQKRYWEKN